MSELNIVQDMLEAMFGLEEMGCELIINDEHIAEIYDNYKMIRNSPEKMAVYNERDYMRIVFEGDRTPDDDKEINCDIKKLGHTAQVILKQSPFMLKNPHMFAGCIVEV